MDFTVFQCVCLRLFVCLLLYAITHTYIQVLTVIVDGVNVSTGALSHACLHLVDLAGSERVAKSLASGEI